MFKSCMFLAAIVLTVAGCRKNSIDETSSTEASKNNNTYGMTSRTTQISMPTTHHGILVFTSKDELDAYMLNIGALEDNVLDSIERSLSYKSYRGVLAAAYDPAEGFSSPDELPERRYHTVSFQSALNEGFEIIVNRQYYNYSRKGYAILCNDLSPETIDRVREKVESVENTLDIISELEASRIDCEILFEEHDESSLKKKFYPADENSVIRFQVDDEYGKNCDGMKYKITKVCAKTYGAVTSSLAGSYTLNWGDGSPAEQWYSAPIVGNWGAAHSADHTYSSPGSYTITITYNGSVIGMGTATTSYSINITQGCGESNGKNKGIWLYPVISGTQYALETTIWSDNNLWSRAIGASSYFYKQKSNGNWKNNDAEIYAEIKGYTTDGNCNGSAWRYNDAWHSSKNKAQAKVTIGSDYSYQVINSFYSVKKDGVTTTYSNDLKTCN